MQDLLDARPAQGWRLLGPRDDPRASADPFKLENGRIAWAIVRGDQRTRVEIEFHALSDLGGRTDRLRDIMYCDVVGTRRRLACSRRAARDL